MPPRTDYKNKPDAMNRVVAHQEAAIAAFPDREGDLRVYWIPQIGADIEPFLVPVTSLVEAGRLLRTLARYDEFQFMNRIKPDYSNAGGLEVFKDGEWEDWYGVNSDGDEIDLASADLTDDALAVLDKQRIQKAES